MTLIENALTDCVCRVRVKRRGTHGTKSVDEIRGKPHQDDPVWYTMEAQQSAPRNQPTSLESQQSYPEEDGEYEIVDPVDQPIYEETF